MHPYKESNTDSKLIREFSSDTDPMDLVWHQDAEHRTVKIIRGSGWKFQFDNDLPFEMMSGDQIWIPQGTVHRVIKGRGDLIVEIIKH